MPLRRGERLDLHRYEWAMFRLDDRLAADTALVDLWDLCEVRLMDDANYPWFVLVPQRTDLREIHDLAPADRLLLMDEIVRATRILEQAWRPDKINVAALGNQVSQLHIHVIARYVADGAWPRPVWGLLPPLQYTKPQRLDVISRFRETRALTAA